MAGRLQEREDERGGHGQEHGDHDEDEPGGHLGFWACGEGHAALGAELGLVVDPFLAVRTLDGGFAEAIDIGGARAVGVEVVGLPIGSLSSACVGHARG